MVAKVEEGTKLSFEGEKEILQAIIANLETDRMENDADLAGSKTRLNMFNVIEQQMPELKGWAYVIDLANMSITVNHRDGADPLHGTIDADWLKGKVLNHAHVEKKISHFIEKFTKMIGDGSNGKG